METITKHNIPDTNEVVAIVKGENYFQYHPEMLKKFKDFFVVCRYNNFEDGFKDNIEGITTLAVVKEYKYALYVYSLESKTVLIFANQAGNKEDLRMALDKYAKQGTFMITDDSSIIIDTLNPEEAIRAMKPRKLEDAIGSVNIASNQISQSKYHK